MNIVEELLTVAEQDLKASICLYESGIFNVSVFQFQQTIEKLVKSYGIEAEIIKEDDLQRKISHLPHKVFARYYRKKIDKEKELDRPLLIADMIPPHQRKKRDERKKYLEGLNKVYNKTNHMSLEEMNNVNESDVIGFIEGFKTLEIFEYDEKSRLKLIKEDIEKTYRHFKLYFKNVLKETDSDPAIELFNMVLSNIDEIATDKLVEDKKLSRAGFRINQIFYAWYNLSLITSPHEQSSRYPSTLGNVPLAVYGSDHLIVKHFEELKEIVIKTIEVYKKLLSSGEIKSIHAKEFEVLDSKDRRNKKNK